MFNYNVGKNKKLLALLRVLLLLCGIVMGCAKANALEAVYDVSISVGGRCTKRLLLP